MFESSGVSRMFRRMSSIDVSSSLDLSSNLLSIFTVAILLLRLRGLWLVNDFEFQAQFVEVSGRVL